MKLALLFLVVVAAACAVYVPIQYTHVSPFYQYLHHTVPVLIPLATNETKPEETDKKSDDDKDGENTVLTHVPLAYYPSYYGYPHYPTVYYTYPYLLVKPQNETTTDEKKE